MSKVVMSFDQQEAEKASGSDYLLEGGAKLVTITKAQFVTAQTGTKGIEFSGETDDGLKVNYLTVYYQKHNNEPISGGRSVINAMMGFCGIKQITATQAGTEYFCREFEGKRLGLFLNKKLYSKVDGNDGFKFEIRVPFCPITNKTMREKANNQPAKTIALMESSYKDIDERQSSSSQPRQTDSNTMNSSVMPDDDIPW